MTVDAGRAGAPVPDVSSRTPVAAGAFSPAALITAFPAALRKLTPWAQAYKPVMFVVYLGAIASTVLAVLYRDGFGGFVAAWLWLTVVFADLAEAVAEDRGRAQAQSLRKAQRESVAHRLGKDGGITDVRGGELRIGDRVVVSAGETIPGDGDVVEGIATVDESAITGESAPVIRESGGDRSAVTGGTTVLSDRIVVRITTEPGKSFVDRMIALVEGSQRRKTPNEIALDVLLATLTIVFTMAVVALGPMQQDTGAPADPIRLIALLVCLIPTTIGALLSSIGIAGMDRLVQRNVLAMSGRAVEAAGDVDVLLLDKTGTITFGNRRATALYPASGLLDEDIARCARLASVADDTPEGRSIVEWCAGRVPGETATVAAQIPFTAQTRMSGVDLSDGTQLRKGAGDAVVRWLADSGVTPPAAIDGTVRRLAGEGRTPLVVARRSPGRAPEVVGVIELSDVVKPGMREKFAPLRAMGIRTVMVTGDNPLTARAIAAEAGVDDVVAEATPEQKLALIRAEQARGNLVAMTGDGTNDAPALAQADVGLAMNSGTSAAKEAGNMVDLDSDPAKLIDVVAVGKQLLITRGALTTFSLANDLAKYFAILPAMSSASYPALDGLNVMRLASPQSAIASAVIFNALIIVALIPLSLRGVRYRPGSAASLLRRNLLVYGLGGIAVPFVGIWLIDLLVRLLPGMG